MRDIALARLTGARVHFQHLSTAGSVAMVAAAKAAGLPVTRRGGAAPLHAHRRVLRDLRPGVQGPPAAAHRRATSRRSRPACVDGVDRRHRHRPRAARGRREGAPVRRGAARDARASSTRWRWRSPSSACDDRARCWPLLSWQPGADRRHRRRHGGPVADGPPGEPLRHRPRRRRGRSTRRAARAARRNVPYVGPHRPGRVRHTIRAASRSCSTVSTRSGDRRWLTEAGPVRPTDRRMSGIRRARQRGRALVLADGDRCFEGEAIGASDRRRAASRHG